MGVCDGSQAGNGDGKPQVAATLAKGLANGFAGPQADPAPRAVAASSTPHVDRCSSRTNDAAMADEGAASVWLDVKKPSSTATSPSETVRPFALIDVAASSA